MKDILPSLPSYVYIAYAGFLALLLIVGLFLKWRIRRSAAATPPVPSPGKERLIRYITYAIRGSIVVTALVAIMTLATLAHRKVEERAGQKSTSQTAATNTVPLTNYRTVTVERFVTNTTLVQHAIHLTNTVLVTLTNEVTVTNMQVVKRFVTNVIPVTLMVTQAQVVAKPADLAITPAPVAQAKKTSLKARALQSPANAAHAYTRGAEATGGIVVNVNNEPSIDITTGGSSKVVADEATSPQSPSPCGGQTVQVPAVPAVAPTAPPSPQIAAPARYPIDITSQFRATHNGKSALLKIRVLLSLTEPPSPETVKLLDTSVGNFLRDMAKVKAQELLALDPLQESEQRLMQRLALDYLAANWKYLEQQKIGLEGAYVSF